MYCIIVVSILICSMFSYSCIDLQCKLDSSEIEKRTLWMSVWNFDRFGHNQFLGEVRLSLSTLNLTDPTEHWYTLLDRVRLHHFTNLDSRDLFLCM